MTLQFLYVVSVLLNIRYFTVTRSNEVQLNTDQQVLRSLACSNVTFQFTELKLPDENVTLR
jgi:hypothetical protein